MRTRALAFLFLAAGGAAAILAQSGRVAPEDKLALSRAERVFNAEEEVGDLPVEATLLFEGEAGRGEKGTMDVLVDLASLPAAAAGRRFRLSLVMEIRGGDTWIEHAAVEAPEAARAAAWAYEARVATPPEMRDLVVVVEELASGAWGAALVEPSAERLAVPDTASLSVHAGVWSLADGVPEPAPAAAAEAGTAAAVSPSPAPSPVAPAAAPQPPPPPAAAGPSSVVRLLQPRGKKLEKGTKVETLVGDFAVAKVAFYLDDKLVATSTKDPFEARIDLAGPGKGQTIRAVASTSEGVELGADSLVVNDPARTFAVRITKVGGTAASGKVEVEAEVAVPVTMRLGRVELYWNETLAGRFTAPPYRASIATGGVEGPADYVRAVAYAADGSSVEDVRLMSARGADERVDVTLVQLYAVATDKGGKPVKNLAREDFTVSLEGKAQSLDRATYATDVPLLLGLVIDTSGSMEPIMTDTKQAAAQFLSQTLEDGDQAFLVDFSTKPRLRHRPTASVGDLLNSFGGLQAEGFTALYDSIIFSLLEFSRGPSRRALVVLTDGADYGSKFGVRRAVQSAERMGVPIYVIALGDERGLGGSARLELEALTEHTGGRLYPVADVSRLGATYAEINEELRSQYLLTFYAPGGARVEDLREVEVKVKRKEVTVRSVLGAE